MFYEVLFGLIALAGINVFFFIRKKFLEVSRKEWLQVKENIRLKLDNYEGNNKEVIIEKVEEIEFWCERITTSHSTQLKKHYVMTRITQLLDDLEQLGFIQLNPTIPSKEKN